MSNSKFWGLYCLLYIAAKISFFCARAAEQVQIDLQIIGNDKPSAFEKVEFKISFGNIPGNPFDPQDINVFLEIKKPDGRTITHTAFYAQNYEFKPIQRGGRMSEWLYPADKPGWFARYSPDIEGNYSVQAVLNCIHGSFRSSPVNFSCVGKSRKGFIRTSKSNPRFFEFADGSPFFPLGQNIAFIGFGQYVSLINIGNIFKKMSDNGANYARVWVCCEDWAIAIEGRKSAFGRSFNWNPPFTFLAGNEGYHRNEVALRLVTNAPAINISPSEPVGLMPNRVYKIKGEIMCDPDTGLIIEAGGKQIGDVIKGDKKGQWKKFEIEYRTKSDQWWLGELRARLTGNGRLLIKEIALFEENSNINLLWEADPNRPIRGVYNQTDCALVDRLIEEAEKNGIYIHFCLFTRDHYRYPLSNPNSPEYLKAIKDAQKLLRYAVARWGYSPSIAVWEYFNEMDPNAPTELFYYKLGEYLEQVDTFLHLRSTSSWGPAPAVWQHPKLDIADLHWYLRPAWSPLWKDEVSAVIDRAKFLRKYATDKPAILGEIGLADDRWGKSEYMEQDKEGIHIHNILWASAFSGLSGAAMFWWWDTLDKLNTYHHYKPLSYFISDIPFNTAKLEAKTLVTSSTNIVAMSLASKNRVYCWLHNNKATWWKLVVDKAVPDEIKEAAVSVDGIENGNYKVQWYNTWEGRTISEKIIKVDNGTVKLTVPTFTRDIAFKMIKL